MADENNSNSNSDSNSDSNINININNDNNVNGCVDAAMIEMCKAILQVSGAFAVLVAGGISIRIDGEAERHFDFDKFLFMDLPLLHFTALKRESMLQCSLEGSCTEEYHLYRGRQVFLG